MDADDNGFSCTGARCGSTAQSSSRQPVAISTPTPRFLFFFPRTPRPNIARARATWFGRRRTTSFSRCWRCREDSRRSKSLRVRSTLPPFTNVEPDAGHAAAARASKPRWFIRRKPCGANQAIERQIVFYAGPKEYRTLARIGARISKSRRPGDEFRHGLHEFLGIGPFLPRRCCWHELAA